jgi:hypothetical protein
MLEMTTRPPTTTTVEVTTTVPALTDGQSRSKDPQLRSARPFGRCASAPDERIAARGFLELLTAAGESDDDLATTLGHEARELFDHDDALLFHDTLADVNQPFTSRFHRARGGARRVSSSGRLGRRSGEHARGQRRGAG